MVMDGCMKVKGGGHVVDVGDDGWVCKGIDNVEQGGANGRSIQ